MRLILQTFALITLTNARLGGGDGVFRRECESFTTDIVCDFIEEEAEGELMSPLELFRKVIGGGGIGDR